MTNFVYVDNSNLWIEGKRVSAVAKKIVPDIWTAIKNRVEDPEWRIDLGKLYEFTEGEDPVRAYLYGSRPPTNDSIWTIAKQKGFELVICDRNAGNREKKIDISIARDIMKHSYELMKPEDDRVILFAGDSDFVPIAENLVERGFKFEVYFWNHISRELKQAASKFVSLDQWLEHLAFR